MAYLRTVHIFEITSRPTTAVRLFIQKRTCRVFYYFQNTGKKIRILHLAIIVIFLSLYIHSYRKQIVRERLGIFLEIVSTNFEIYVIVEVFVDGHLVLFFIIPFLINVLLFRKCFL